MLGFQKFFVNTINKIWIFWKHTYLLSILDDFNYIINFQFLFDGFSTYGFVVLLTSFFGKDLSP